MLVYWSVWDTLTTWELSFEWIWRLQNLCHRCAVLVERSGILRSHQTVVSSEEPIWFPFAWRTSASLWNSKSYLRENKRGRSVVLLGFLLFTCLVVWGFMIFINPSSKINNQITRKGWESSFMRCMMWVPTSGTRSHHVLGPLTTPIPRLLSTLPIIPWNTKITALSYQNGNSLHLFGDVFSTPFFGWCISKYDIFFI